MALKTLGSNSTTTLNALVAGVNLSPTDIATLRSKILNDLVNGNPIWPGGFEFNSGLLSIPNRGVVKVLPGDYVAVDPTGWPILVSAAAIASGSTGWTHN